MRLRRRTIVAATLLAAVMLGCGGPENSGPPKSVDMSKNYAPAAKVDFMNPSMQKDAAKAKAPPTAKTP